MLFYLYTFIIYLCLKYFANILFHIIFVLSICILKIFPIQMNVVVHKYLMGVRKLQRNIRDFIACKSAKITSLGMLWLHLERIYVRKMLEKRKLQKRSTGKIHASESEFVEMDRRTLLEMKNQAKLWSRIDTKMEDRIKELKASGMIVLESDEESMAKFMLPAKERWQALTDLLQFLVTF